MPPGLADPVVYGLDGTGAVPTAQALGRALNFEVDSALGRAQLDLPDLPGCLQPQGCGEQGFRAQAHVVCDAGWMMAPKFTALCTRASGMLCEVKFHSKRHRAPKNNLKGTLKKKISSFATRKVRILIDAYAVHICALLPNFSY